MPPFTILHVCVGNICRSPMSERLLAQRLRHHVGVAADQLYLNHGAGTGPWHVGEPMNAPAARQIRERGGDATNFRARHLAGELVDLSDLIVCATAEQVEFVGSLRPDAVARTFVLGELGRLLTAIDLTVLPPWPSGDADAAQGAHDRGTALVVAADAARDGGAVWGSSGDQRAASRRSDDLDDPWGMDDRAFARVADLIERTMTPLAAALTAADSPTGPRRS